MPHSRERLSLVRRVTKNEWITNGFLPEFLAFTHKPENRGIRANLRHLGNAGIHLLSNTELPNSFALTVENRQMLLRNIGTWLQPIKTNVAHLLPNPRGLDLSVMLEFDPELKKQLGTIRYNLALTTRPGQQPAETPVSAFGIVLARIDPESIQPSQHQPLLDLVGSVCPRWAVLGRAEALLTINNR